MKETTILVNANVIDVVKGRSKPNRILIVKNKKIEAIKKRIPINYFKRYEVIDINNNYVMPGLCDMHCHITKLGRNALKVYLAYGVTMIRDMGGDPDSNLVWRDNINAGKLIGPKMFTCGPMLESQKKIEELKKEQTVEPFWKYRIGIKKTVEVDSVIQVLAKMRVDFIKVRSVETKAIYLAICKAAKKNKLNVVGHCAIDLEEVINERQRSLEHVFIPPLCNYSKKTAERLIRKMKRNGTFVSPTLVTVTHSFNVPKEKGRKLLEDSLGELTEGLKYSNTYLKKDWNEQLEERGDELLTIRDSLEPYIILDLQILYKNNVQLVAGTDAGVVFIYPGSSLHDEIINYVNLIGMSNAKALQAATLTATKCLGIDKDFGTIEKGKNCDLLILKSNPLEDIQNIRKVEGVIANGIYFNKEALNQNN